MQITKSQGNIVEKVLRDKEGKLIRARFFVYENNGRIRARLIDFVYLAEQILLESGKLLLSSFTKVKAVISESSNIKSYISPFVILNTIYSFGSKPRAPTLI